MADTVPVVVVKGADGGPLRINQSDFDENPDAWELFDGEIAQSASTTTIETTVADTTTAEAPQMLVAKKGRKFLVVDGAGDAITGIDGIDPTGYATDVEAWAAVTAVKTA